MKAGSVKRLLFFLLDHIVKHVVYCIAPILHVPIVLILVSGVEIPEARVVRHRLSSAASRNISKLLGFGLDEAGCVELSSKFVFSVFP
jgi:hypothetical protein